MTSNRGCKFVPKVRLTKIQNILNNIKNNRKKQFKMHFKGVESVFINPKPMYNMLKLKNPLISKDRNLIIECGKNDKNEPKIEYKEDEENLILEEKKKQKIINSEEFSKFLDNKHYFGRRSENLTSECNKEEFEKNMAYLRDLAFNQKSINPSEKENLANMEKGADKGKINYYEINIKIGGKTLNVETQIDKIAKEVLNKCKFYTIMKK